MIAISLRYKDRLFYQETQENVRLSFGSDKKDTVYVKDMVESQITISIMNEGLSIHTESPFLFNNNRLAIDTPIRIDSNTGTLLFASKATGFSTKKVPLPHNGIIKIGRADINDVAIGLPFVSGRHFQLRITDGNIRVEDLDSTNGLYRNGMKIKAALLESGDTLNILTVRIRLVNNELHFENVGNFLKIAPTLLQNKQSFNTPVNQEKKTLQFRLSPRIQDCLPQETIVLDRPPKKGQEYHPRGSRIASMISMGAMAGASLAMGVASPALAFARAISVAAGVYNMAAGNKMEKQRQAEMEEYNRRRDEEYKTYIDAQRARIMAVATEQRRIISEENPEPAKCLKMVESLDRRLWERMISDRDFLDVRLGMGYEDLCVPIKNYAENRGLIMEDDELEDLCNNIAEENRIVDHIPIRISLRSTPTIGIIGNRDKAVHLVRNMLVSLATQHSHNDVQIVGIFDNGERSRWASLRWLPHIWDNSRQFRYLAFDKERAHTICEMLQDILKRRYDRLSEDYGNKSFASAPHFVVILGDRSKVEREQVMELLTSNNDKLGVTTIFMFDDLYFLPQECSYFVDLNSEYPSIYGKYNANQRTFFDRDPSVSTLKFGDFARRMAAIELEDTRLNNALPSTLTFLEGMGVTTVENLNVLQRWRNNKVVDSLRTPIGVLASGKPFYLDIHYKAHGAHGLLAGTTGSGKSELLRTWILSMAVNYHPHEVNFVIIDYKGGGMANKLESLPHVVGKITNIDTNISRSLVSLKREAKRRMLILESHPGVDDVDQYMQLYYSGKVTEPMPHLIVVSDEFAELKKEEPEFLKELSSLARVGRSVGIHLVLATQRPTGVVDDQIDSNSRFRICMKVNSVQDSKEIIKKPDAAAITQRGRAYVRIGEDELFDLIQSYWSGAEYLGNQSATTQFSNQVSIVDISGERIQRNADTLHKKQRVGTDQLTAIVNHIIEQVQFARINRLSGPWKPELPDILPLHTLDISVAFTGTGWIGMINQLRVPIGMFDLPALQQQGVQYMDFSAKPHYGIYGGPASGKTTLLKTMIISMAMQFAPSDVNMYILDFGGRSLSVFETMPHVAMVIQENEEDKLNKFVAWLQSEINSRKVRFEKEKVSNFEKYRQKNHDMPAIFVVIDNLLRLSTIYTFVDPFLIELSMTGSDCGIHLVFTSNNINKTSMNLRTNIGGSIALHMTDHNDYRVAISEFPEGSRAPVNPGRALIRDTASAEFQTAIFMPDEDDEQNNAALEKLLQQMKDSWSGPKIETVKSMPDSLTVEDIVMHYTDRAVLPVGLSYDELQPVFIDLSDKHSMLIASVEPNEGTDAMKTLANILLSKTDNQLYVLDGSGSLFDIDERVVGYANNADSLNNTVKELAVEISKREEVLFDCQDSGEVCDTHVFVEQYPQICIMIDSMHRVMEALSDKNREMLLHICQNTEKLGFIAVAHGTVNDLRMYMYTESLTMAFVDDPEFAATNWQKGLCIGGSIRNHDYFTQKMLSAEEKAEKIILGDGVVFDCGKVTRIKRVQ